jgi:hypothetical protein
VGFEVLDQLRDLGAALAARRTPGDVDVAVGPAVRGSRRMKEEDERLGWQARDGTRLTADEHLRTVSPQLVERRIVRPPQPREVSVYIRPPELAVPQGDSVLEGRPVAKSGGNRPTGFVHRAHQSLSVGRRDQDVGIRPGATGPPQPRVKGCALDVQEPHGKTLSDPLNVGMRHLRSDVGGDAAFRRHHDRMLSGAGAAEIGESVPKASSRRLFSRT